MKINDFKTANNNSSWIFAQAKELRALFMFNSLPMVALNKTRALATISSMQEALEELKQYIDSLEG